MSERFFLAEGRLWLGVHQPGRRRAGMRLEPRGAVVVTGTGHAALHEWRHHDGELDAPEAWYLASSDSTQQRGTVVVQKQRLQPVCGASDQIVLALVEYLAVCPAARPALAEPTLLAHLTRAMNEWEPIRPVPRGPLPFTERWDIHHALEPLVDDAVLVIRGRPVGGQPLPDFEAITWAAKPHLDPEVFHDHILDEAKRMLSATPWPFEALLTG